MEICNRKQKLTSTRVVKNYSSSLLLEYYSSTRGSPAHRSEMTEDNNWLIGWVKVLRPTSQKKTGYFGDVLPGQSLSLVPKKHKSNSNIPQYLTKSDMHH